MRDITRMKKRISTAFTRVGFKPQAAEEIAFHITDWEQDLIEIMRMYDGVEELNEERIRNIIIKFLAHVPNHLAAAKKLVGLGPIEDVFGVGVLMEDD